MNNRKKRQDSVLTLFAARIAVSAALAASAASILAVTEDKRESTDDCRSDDDY